MELDIWDDFLTIEFGDNAPFPYKKAHVKGETFDDGFVMYASSPRWVKPVEEGVCESQKAKLFQCIINEGKKQDYKIEIDMRA